MASDGTFSFRLVSYNIRYDCKPDSITVNESLARLPDPNQEPRYLGLAGVEQPWSARRIRIAQDLLSEGVVLAAFQEALLRQVNDMAELLGGDWAWVGVGRDDGASKGEFNPIFYKKSVFKLITHDTFWLSPTPFRPSVYPRAGCNRICTVARFVTHASEKKVTVLNTHLDHVSDIQRRYGASLLLIRGGYEAATASESPVFVTGDFNSPPTGSDSGAYNIITGNAPPLEVDTDFVKRYDRPQPGFKFLDTRVQTHRSNVSANFATFTGWSPTDTREWVVIDFVLGGSNLGWESSRCKVGAGMSDDGMMHSDHRPVFVDFNI